MIGVIADDYTGATDVAVAFQREKLRTALMFGTPQRDVVLSPSDAVIIALRSRMLDPADASSQSVAALRWLQSQGATQIYFKYCSTFDSTARGNIGPTLDALADALGVDRVLTTPSAPGLQRTQYLGYLFVGDTLLSESPMRHHPLTPMTDSYLPRLLSAQSDRGVGVIPLDTVRAGVAAIGLAADAAVGQGRCYLLVDAIAESDLTVIGEAVVNAPLVAGASGLARGLATAVAARPRSPGRPAGAAIPATPAGPIRTVILAGSCSARTLEQIAEYQRGGGPSHRIDPRSGDAECLVDDALQWYDSLPEPAHALVYSSVPPDELAEIQSELGVADSATTLERALGLVAAALPQRGVTRIVAAGGETAGAVVTALGITGGMIGTEAAPGVPWILTDRFELLLKSGNFGDARLFINASLADIHRAEAQ